MSEDSPIQVRTSIWQKIILIIFGILFCVVFIEIGLRLGNFISLSFQEYLNRKAIHKKGTYRIMCLGESTTAGGKNSYPAQLEDILNQRNIGIKFSVINKGQNTIDTTYILEHLENNIEKYKPDTVISMMGMNDEYIKFYQNIPDVDNMLFKKFRAYRFMRIIWMQIVNRIRNREIYIAKESNKNAQLHFTFSDTGLTGLFYKDRDPKISRDLRVQSLGECKNSPTDIEESLRGKSVMNFSPTLSTQTNSFQEKKILDKRFTEVNPQNEGEYFDLGKFYRNQDKFIQAEESFMKAIELNPKSIRTYLALGYLYELQGKSVQVEESFKKAIEIDPKCDISHFDLGKFYKKQGKFIQAEESFMKAIELNPRNGQSYIELGFLYKDQGKFTQAEEVFKKAIEFNPMNPEVYGASAVFYKEIGKDKTSEEYFKKVDELRPENCNSITQRNYLKVKEILDKRCIKLVCVQYPMRSVEPLKKIFEGQEEVVFVNNEQVFKEALKQSSYKEYFVDMFGGDFGHCTRKGNRLLAENIANVILKRYFRQKP